MNIIGLLKEYSNKVIYKHLSSPYPSPYGSEAYCDRMALLEVKMQ